MVYIHDPQYVASHCEEHAPVAGSDSKVVLQSVTKRLGSADGRPILQPFLYPGDPSFYGSRQLIEFLVSVG